MEVEDRGWNGARSALGTRRAAIGARPPFLSPPPFVWGPTVELFFLLALTIMDWRAVLASSGRNRQKGGGKEEKGRGETNDKVLVMRACDEPG